MVSNILPHIFLMKKNQAIHLVGDIHQPLHAVRGVFNDTRFGDLPRGDLGGNLLRTDGGFFRYRCQQT